MFGNAANSAHDRAAAHGALRDDERAARLGRGHLPQARVAEPEHAVMREPMTLADHQASRPIVDPLKKLDCCLISDGAVAIIVTSAERARDCRKRPVSPARHGPGPHAADLRAPGVVVPAAPARRDRSDAYAMAGVGPADIDVAQLYDNFTISVLLWLEHGGFCEQGESGPVRRGRRADRASAASCRSTPPAGTCPSRTCRAGCTSSRACARSAASAATARSRAPSSASSPAAA